MAKYDVEVDIWSAGCIFAEMIEGKPLFPGKDHVHQFSIITDLLGSPPKDVINTICSENTLKFVTSLPHRDPISFSERFKTVEPDAVDLLEKMLVFDPKKRVTAADALAHPYLAPYHDPTDEPVADAKFDWHFNDADLPVDTWRVMMYSEILDFHKIGGSDGQIDISATFDDQVAAATAAAAQAQAQVQLHMSNHPHDDTGASDNNHLDITGGNKNADHVAASDTITDYGNQAIQYANEFQQ